MDSFQEGKAQLFIGNMKAAGVGLTLTAASNVAIIQYPWNPGILNQAIDRIHRITQIKQVSAWMLIGENTIEEKILDVLQEKQLMANRVLDGQNYTDTSIVMDLINSYKRIKA